MNKLVLILSFLMLLPFQAFGDDTVTNDTIAKIEAQMDAAFDKGDIKAGFNAGKEALKSSQMWKFDEKLYRTLADEIEKYEKYWERLVILDGLTKVKGKEAEAIAYYPYLIQAYNDLPDKYHFSERFTRGLKGGADRSIEWAEKFVKKECGDDYQKIRVGMKISQVQKCVAEYFLHGQMKLGQDVVDHYKRGAAYLYVQNGTVTAWGE
ncbi:MAG: hypothetical protein PHY09_18345 [Desulfuromonadaceae bacterium]|nr:hypothetical protein [Desulfuromonadaceae bacterium]